jgi:uncharacterized membrane protein
LFDWPSLHPAFVHFPVALISTALGLDVACLVFRRQIWLDRAAATLHILGFFTAGAAVIAGKLAQNSLGSLSPEINALVEKHSEWAFLALVAFFLLAGLRFDTAWRDRERSEIQLHHRRFQALVLAALTLWVVFQTATRGASLVFDHGVAVEKQPVISK